jgi:type II secretory ATPase GspE/PulE/Tfp pilus assembly ATPase PilB-like protein
MAEQEEPQLWQTAAPVEFVPHIDERTEAQALLISTRQGAGFGVAAGQLGHALQSRATHLLMDYSQNACAMRYQIDGAWEQLPPLDRETGDAMLYAMKQLCLLNPADRRSAQTGKCTIKMGKEKHTLTLQAQGVASGERVLAKLEPVNVPFKHLSDLGMRDKMIESLKEQLNSEGTIVLITAPMSAGLTTTWAVTVEAADRFIRDFQAFEDKEKPEPETININPNFFGGDTGLTEPEMLRKAILKEPDVIVFPELPQPDSMELAIDQVEKNDKQIYTRMVADSAMAGLVQLLPKYRDSAGQIVKHISAVLCQKLARRLCDDCKVGFEPQPQLLKQLGIPAGRVAMLYQPFVPPPIEQQVDENGRPDPVIPCQACNGRGYLGRIAIFELLRPGEQLQAALMKTQDLAKLNHVAKTEGHRSIQSEAVLAVARGLTSLEELKRIFASG